MSTPDRVVVVGAGIGGLRTAQALRSAGHTGAITLVGDEPGVPYDRPPLSKQVLQGDWAPERVELTTPDDLGDLAIEWMPAERAVALEGSRLRLATGRALEFDALVVATGARARRLSSCDYTTPGVHELRSLGDSLALRERLAGGRHVVLAGGGFIGAEVAAAAIAAGCTVTLLDADPTPFARTLGDAVGAALAAEYELRGVTVRTGAAVRAVAAAPDGERVHVSLRDNSELVADDVVVGIGAVPATAWLPDSAAGVRCDETGRARDIPGLVFAVGDAAAWPDPWGEHRRIEHWNTAVDHARVVAAHIVGAEPPPVPPPYFWSDQFDLKLQLTGWPYRADRVYGYHAPNGRPVWLYTEATGASVAALTINAPAVLARARALVAVRAPLADVVDRLGLVERDAPLTVGNA